MKHIVSALAVVAFAGHAMAQISSINSMQLAAYENFRHHSLPGGDGQPPRGTATFNGNPIVPNPAYPGPGNAPDTVSQNNYAAAIAGPHTLRDQYPVGSPGFANRHILWFSNDGGATPYQLQAGDSFRVSACFRTNTNHPTGVGAPVNSETGFWIHNPRVNEQGTPFIDEGGVWLITNGTSFSGGSGQDFFLFGEGGFNNPAAPPIYGNNELVEMTYEYFAAGHFGPGSNAGFQATVNNLTRGVSVSSGLKNFNAIPNSGENGLNPGATFGFRFQNQIFSAIPTDTTTEVFNVTIIPAPAGVMLLGLAGLAAGRRRR